MRFLLTVFGDSSTWGSLPDEEARAELEAFATFEREAEAAGVLADKGALEPAAYELSLADGAPRLAERPLGERAMGCFYVLDVDGVEQVGEWAAKIPLVGRGGFDAIEIRPFTA